jgi:uncharacterized protein (TIGR00369 family)
MIHCEFRISYERPLFVGEEALCRMQLEDSYDKQSRRGLLGFPAFRCTGESPDGESRHRRGRLPALRGVDQDWAGIMPTRPMPSKVLEEGATVEKAAAMDKEQLARLVRYFEENTFSRHIGAKVEDVDRGRSVVYIDVEDFHLNGAGTLHGGVYATLIDNAMGLSVVALVGVRTATIEMNVHFLGAVSEGRITCHSQVAHRTRRTATAEAKVHDTDGNLVAMGTGAFRVFEKKGNAIV